MLPIVLLADQIITMLLLVLLGYVLKKRKLLHDLSIQDITNLLIKLIIPIVIIYAFCVPYNSLKAEKLILSLFFSIIIHLLFIIMANFLFKNNGVFQNAVILSNAGFMGIPLIMSVLGIDAVFYLSAYMAINSIVQWSYGLSKLNHQYKLTLSSVLFSPVMIALLIGLSIFFLRIQLPKQLLIFFDYISSCNTPLAMIILGTTLTQLHISDLRKDIKIIIIPILCRLLLFPFIILLIFSIFPSNLNDLKIIHLILAASPTALSVALFASQYNVKQTHVATEIVCLTTLLCLFTIPFILIFIK